MEGFRFKLVIKKKNKRFLAALIETEAFHEHENIIDLPVGAQCSETPGNLYQEREYMIGKTQF